MKTYVTYLSSNDYLLGVLSLHESWKRTKSIYDFHCMVSNVISEDVVDILKKNKIKIIRFNQIKIPENLIDYNENNCYTNYQVLKNYYNKIVIYGLDKFEKVVYMDADMIMIENIDELFDFPHMSAVLNHEEKGVYYFNSGIMVIEPSKKLFIDMLKSLAAMTEKEMYNSANKDHHCLWDQDFLNYYFKNWAVDIGKILHIKYNAFWNVVDIYGVPVETIKVAHMVGKKPWFMSLEEINEHVNKKAGSAYLMKKFIDIYVSAIGVYNG
jgi:glycogenin glucosyltransferase